MQYQPKAKRSYLKPKKTGMHQADVNKAHFALAGAVTVLNTVISRVENVAKIRRIPAPAVHHIEAAITHIRAAQRELPPLRQRDTRRTT